MEINIYLWSLFNFLIIMQHLFHPLQKYIFITIFCTNIFIYMQSEKCTILGTRFLKKITHPRNFISKVLRKGRKLTISNSCLLRKIFIDRIQNSTQQHLTYRFNIQCMCLPRTLCCYKMYIHTRFSTVNFYKFTQH